MGEYFHMRQLIWDEICPSIRPSEAEELRRAIGNHLIDGNRELRQELGVLVEILSEFQQQSDGIREALVQRHRQRLPEPPGRALLLDKLKLLALDLRVKSAESSHRHHHHHHMLQSPKDQEILKYVLSADDSDSESEERTSSPPCTPRMAELSSSVGYGFSSTPRDAVLLRPGTSSGTRPTTATTSSSSRPVSRGSTLSASSCSSFYSSTSSIVESPELRKRLNVEEIDSIKEEVQEALHDEKLQLLEDIDFIQSCIEMEQELLDDDRRRVTSVRPPPSLQELQDLRRVLEKTLEDQDDHDRVESILSKTTERELKADGGAVVAGRRVSSSSSAGRALHPLVATSGTMALPLPRPPPPRERDAYQQDEELLSQSASSSKPRDSKSSGSSSRSSSRSRRSSSSQDTSSRGSSSSSTTTTKVLKIRHVIQEARDEPFLT